MAEAHVVTALSRSAPSIRAHPAREVVIRNLGCLDCCPIRPTRSPALSRTGSGRLRTDPLIFGICGIDGGVNEPVHASQLMGIGVMWFGVIDSRCTAPGLEFGLCPLKPAETLTLATPTPDFDNSAACRSREPNRWRAQSFFPMAFQAALQTVSPGFMASTVASGF